MSESLLLLVQAEAGEQAKAYVYVQRLSAICNDRPFASGGLQTK